MSTLGQHSFLSRIGVEGKGVGGRGGGSRCREGKREGRETERVKHSEKEREREGWGEGGGSKSHESLALHNLLFRSKQGGEEECLLILVTHIL